MQSRSQQNEKENHPYFAGCIGGGVYYSMAWSIAIFEVKILIFVMIHLYSRKKGI